eukprot:1160420-Pelagomonas_calceolata.AAC.14
MEAFLSISLTITSFSFVDFTLCHTTGLYMPGWWDARKRDKKPLLALCLQPGIPHMLLGFPHAYAFSPVTTFELIPNSNTEKGA